MVSDIQNTATYLLQLSAHCELGFSLDASDTLNVSFSVLPSSSA